MDGLLDYKQQQEDEALKKMFDDYSYMQSPEYWYDYKSGMPSHTGRYMTDSYGRGVYSGHNFARPNDLHFLQEERDFYDNNDPYLGGMNRYSHYWGNADHTPPIDTMAFPEWFAKEQLINRQVAENNPEYKHSDAVKFALDLESHKRDPFEVENYHREQLSNFENGAKRQADHYRNIADRQTRYAQTFPQDSWEYKDSIKSGNAYNKFAREEDERAAKYAYKRSRIHE